MCGKPPQTILDYEHLTRLVGGFVVGQSLPQKWPKFVFAAPKWTPKGSRTPQIDSNQLGTVGDTVWGYRFGGLGLGLGEVP